MADSSLRKASRYYKRKQFAKLINHLQPQVFMFRENLEYYKLIGAACFFTGDFGGCLSYTKRAIDIEPSCTFARLFLAATCLKRRESDKAIQQWLAVLDYDSGNRFAKKGLQFVRTLSSMDDLREKVTTKCLYRLVPKPFRIVTPARMIILALIITAIYFALNGLPELELFSIDRGEDRAGVEKISFPQGQTLTSLEGEYEIVLNEREIQDLLDEIKKNFNTHRDNLVRRDVNTLLISTATKPVKERVQLLVSLLEPPDFLTDDVFFEYDEVVENLPLYAGTFVRWKGRATNIQTTDDSVSFTLLVGYHTGQVLQGSVDVVIPFATRIRPDMGVEIIAQVVPLEDTRNQANFVLKGSSVRVFSLEND